MADAVGVVSSIAKLLLLVQKQEESVRGRSVSRRGGINGGGQWGMEEGRVGYSAGTGRELSDRTQLNELNGRRVL